MPTPTRAGSLPVTSSQELGLEMPIPLVRIRGTSGVTLPLSAVAKFNRAQVHFQALQADTRTFFNAKPYRIRRESNADMTEHRFHIDFTSDPPSETWGLLLGDGLHNLRCALDHAVYAIGVNESGVDPPPQGKRLQFLITEDDTKWDADQWHLKTLSQPAQATIKGQQPRGYADEFALTPLGGLQEFDNTDKHRVLRLPVTFVRSATFPIRGLPPGVQCQLTWHVGPLKPGVPILTLRTGEAAANVEMQDGFTLDVGIAHVRLNGNETTLPVWETIDSMNSAVTNTLTALAPFC